MASNHTPGRWLASGLSIVTQNRGRVIAAIQSTTVYGRPPEEAYANAQILAAAPTMYDAIRSALHALQQGQDNDAYGILEAVLLEIDNAAP